MASDSAHSDLDTMETNVEVKPDAPDVADVPDAPAVNVRKCMMCKTEFPSGWSGERICRKCKSTDKWRSA